MLQSSRYRSRERGVSPLVGTVMLLAITLVLTGLVFLMSGKLTENELDDVPVLTLKTTESSDRIEVHHGEAGAAWVGLGIAADGPIGYRPVTGGDPVHVPNGTTVPLDGETILAGQSIQVCGWWTALSRVTVTIVHLGSNTQVGGDHYFSTVRACQPDQDDDGIPDESDNCPFVSNPLQADNDGDGLGDACDPDDDNDGFSDVDEGICGSDPMVDEGTLPVDTDGDGLCDNGVDNDDDNDGLSDAWEADCGGYATVETPCPYDPIDPDTDGDGTDDGAEDPDNDGLDNVGEQDAGTDYAEADTDGDGLDDGDEVLVYGCDPKDPDADEDGLSDGPEAMHGTSCTTADSDGDGLPDGTEDSNNNGIVDATETDPTKPDTDGDGIDDGVEDANQNGVVDAGETDPRNPDTDGDGLADGAEAPNGCDPLVPDSDGDTLSDGDEVNTHGTLCYLADSDADGLDDAEEVNTYGTLPMDPDTDGDFIKDGTEINDYGTDAFNPDTDGDLVNDGPDACPFDGRPDPTPPLGTVTDADGDGCWYVQLTPGFEDPANNQDPDDGDGANPTNDTPPDLP